MENKKQTLAKIAKRFFAGFLGLSRSSFSLEEKTKVFTNLFTIKSPSHELGFGGGEGTR
jgi:hypothetical protein